MNEITLKMNGRNPKRPITGAPVITDGRTDGRTNELTNIIFFLPFPKTKPLVPRGNYINLFHLCMCVSVFVGEGRGGEGGGLKRVILTSNTYGHCHILTHLTKFGDNCKVNLTTGVCKLC